MTGQNNSIELPTRNGKIRVPKYSRIILYIKDSGPIEGFILESCTDHVVVIDSFLPYRSENGIISGKEIKIEISRVFSFILDYGPNAIESKEGK